MANRQQRRQEAAAKGKRGPAVAAITPADAVTHAIRVHEQGFRTHDDALLARARAMYERVLEGTPEQPDALHFLGILLHQTGEGTRAVELIERAIELAPRHVDMRSNLGNVLKEQGRLPEALVAYRAAVDVDATHANAHNNLGTVYKALERNDDAIAAFERAIAIAPRHADAHYNLGNVLVRADRFTEALEHYSHALAIAPGHSDARRRLGMALYYSGKPDEARDVFKRWVELEPDNAVAKHMLAGSEGRSPARASDGYVRASFDGFASSFDEHLSSLGYRAPELVEAAIAAHVPGDGLDVLDAGCGTGLCAPFLKQKARRLVGVDLSRGMLDRARTRGQYDALIEAELTGYLEAHARAYDLVVLADTLCYFGDLAPVTLAAASTLRTGGTLVFTVEQDDAVGDVGYRLNPHGRYSHAAGYVRGVLERAGFDVLALASETLRMERGAPVQGVVAVARAKS